MSLLKEKIMHELPFSGEFCAASLLGHEQEAFMTAASNKLLKLSVQMGQRTKLGD